MSAYDYNMGSKILWKSGGTVTGSHGFLLVAQAMAVCKSLTSSAS